MEFSVSLEDRIKLDTHLNSNAKLIGITGPSGAGKSSLLRALAGFERNAQVTVNWHLPQANISEPKIGLVFQQPMLFPHLTVKGNLALAQQYASANAASYAQVIKGCEITHLLDKPIQALSGGEGQRVAIARALLNGPNVLLLDESLSALDIGLRHRVLAFITQLTMQLPMKCIWVSHDLQDLARYSDVMLIIEDQGLSYAGAAQDALYYLNNNSSQEHVFGVLQGCVIFPKELDRHSAPISGVPPHLPDDNNDVGVQEGVGVQESVGVQTGDGTASGLLDGYLCVDVLGHTLYAEAARGGDAVVPPANGDAIKLVITANEVSIDTATNTAATTMSIVNALPCTISEIKRDGLMGNASTSALVLLDVTPKESGKQSQILYARVSQLSLTRLNLRKGMRVVARFKMLRV
ncbi:ATP-binding cassette domain-containing protein [Alteromonas sp. 345S023]|uniref:ATP-binding cassette domain-containing protein n=1 Tax=Alteromonas profundi TaxID=2696062 RepID=A0A7X5LJS7_9ALTE|nr:ATP-binding cassette domain-containing protein [Alteromonas profundi]NDV90672.1 ATP-binding cassette domain-containing protein [Alteromonas profundi]